MEIEKKHDNRKIISIWLGIGCLFIFGIVVAGGITRLTRSGLSITEWKPISGILPPSGEEGWQLEFEKYKKTPEYQKINMGMTLSEFKYIFTWEFIHRLIGRLIGLIFTLPLFYFLLKKVIPPEHKYKYISFAVLVGLQGALGWIMVASGLNERPSVSHFRLAAHLSLAFFIFLFIFHHILSLYFTVPIKSTRTSARLKIFVISLGIIISLQIIWGGFMAGLKAGSIYPTFPKMGDEWIPGLLFSRGSFFTDLVNDPASVQFTHRVLGVFACIGGFLLLVYGFISKIDIPLKKSILGFFLLLVIQFALGVFTLIYHMPRSLAILHQANALLVLTSLVYIYQKIIRRSP